MPKINKSFVEKVSKPEKGQVFYRDDMLPGFGLRVTSGSKTYIVEGWVKGKNRSCRVTLGKHGKLTAEQARIEAKRYLSEIATGVNPNAVKAEEKVKGITLAALWADYRQTITLRPATIKVYEGALRRCFSDWLDKPITSITKDMVEKRFLKYRNANGPRGEGKAHAHQIMRVLRCLLNFAASKYEDSAGRSILPENPVKRLSQAKLWKTAAPQRRTTVIQPNQLKPWFNAVMSLGQDDARALENGTMRDYLLICLFTGLRRNEAARLTWNDVDLTSEMLVLKGDATKNHQDHRLPLSDFLVALLKSRRAKCVDNELYVFPGRNAGSPLIESKFSVAKVCKLSGVKFTVHDLRRTFLTIAEGLDLPHYVLKRLANHKSTDITGGYIVPSLERLREPMQMITNYICLQVRDTSEQGPSDSSPSATGV
ncbi:MAG: integrase family protein [Candidatus Melainabacteria bacterium]|nr:integrase family protein [Candidatus Melainabacteria bacterium]